MMLGLPTSAAVNDAPALESIRLRVLSLGAGVQSTTLALMAAHGEVGPMPDCAIFSNTGWKPKAVYQHLAWLMSPNVLPFPIHIVSGGNIRDDLIAGAQGARWASIPAFTRNVTPAGTAMPVFDEGDDGELVAIGKRILPTDRVDVGMIRRQCTKDYKIVPIRRKVRELVGLAGRRSPNTPIVEQWIGISLDEAIRMKPSFEDWQVNRWPLIESASRARTACAGWRGTTIPSRRRAHASAVPFTPTPIGGGCGTAIRTPGTTRFWSIARYAPAFVAFAARSSCIARRCRSTRLTSPTPAIAASSISGPTSARAWRRAYRARCGSPAWSLASRLWASFFMAGWRRPSRASCHKRTRPIGRRSFRQLPLAISRRRRFPAATRPPSRSSPSPASPVAISGCSSSEPFSW